MKSYNNLFDKLLSDENINLALLEAFHGKQKKSYKSVRKITDNPESFKERIKREILEGYKNDVHHPKEIYDGISHKKRTIIVPSAREQVVHHMVCNILIPIISPSMYEHSYASLPGKGAVYGKKHIEKMINKYPKQCRYYYKADVRKFFDSIDHNILIDKLGKIIRDKRFLALLSTIINATERGLPLGFYTSQWLANFYLTGFDHWIKEVVKAPYYYRYMDDIVIFGPNKRELRRIHSAIVSRLREQEHLEIKHNWQIVRFHYIRMNGKSIGRDLDYMGYRFFRGYTTIRKRILRKARRKAIRINNKDEPNIIDCRQMLSYKGYFDRTATYGYYQKYIKPLVNINTLRWRVSLYDRRIRQNDKMV